MSDNTNSVQTLVGSIHRPSEILAMLILHLNTWASRSVEVHVPETCAFCTTVITETHRGKITLRNLASQLSKDQDSGQTAILNSMTSGFVVNLTTWFFSATEIAV